MHIVQILFRWTARFAGSIVIGYVLLDAFGSGFPDLTTATIAERLQFAMLFLTLVGYALLWKWEILGGLISVGGMALFYFVDYAYSGRFPKGWVLASFFVPGVMALISGLIERASMDDCKT